MINFSDPDFVANPYPALKELRQHGKPVWHEELGIFLAARYNDANAVLRTKTLRSNLYSKGTREPVE
jgi:cytochrome P450